MLRTARSAHSGSTTDASLSCLKIISGRTTQTRLGWRWAKIFLERRCYQAGDISAAEKCIRIADGISPLNRFVVEVRCTIAIRMGDLTAAEKLLAILERADPGGYYFHRRSVFEQARGDQYNALEFAKK